MKLRRSGRHSVNGDSSSQSRANELPPDVLQLLAARLSIEDLARASAACKVWAHELRQGITSVSLVVPSNTVERHPAVCALAAHSPSLQQLQVLLSGRSKDPSLQGVLSNLHLLQKLASLRLTFMVSPTPKRGPWPLYFFDANLGRVTSLTLEGAAMPRSAVMNLLEGLAASRHLKQLQMLTGQPPPTTQLPAYKPPVYLSFGITQLVGLSGDCLARLVKIPTLSDLTIPHDPNLPATGYRQLTKLKGLTSLKLLGCLSGLTALQRLGQLKRLRRLTACVRLPQVAAELNAGQFQHLRELHLGLQGPAPASSVTSLLQSVAAGLPVSLCGLTLHHLTLDEPLLELLAGITSLHSLELLGMQLGPAGAAVAAGAAAGAGSRGGLNLSCLGRLQGIKKFRLSLSAAPADLPVAFGASQQPQQQGRMERRRGSWPAQQQQQAKADAPSWGDLSGLPKAWPGLQELQLTGLPMTSITSSWDSLRGLTGLTSLTLQLAPGPAPDLSAVAQQVTLEMGGPGAVLRLGQLPGELRQLQLDSVILEVPMQLPFEASLTSLSLATCLLRSHEQPADVASNNDNIASAGSCSNHNHAAAPGPVTRSRRSSSNNHAAAIGDAAAAGSSPRTPLPRALPKSPPPPLAPLLQGLPRLQQLELINLPWLDDSLLAAAGAATAEAGSLTGLSVIGVGIQGLTHGGLLGLTGLQKLRQLRWHVGDALELMPDLSALAQLRGLVALQLPTWLNSQMERWGAYAVLDKLPLCDVSVECS